MTSDVFSIGVCCRSKQPDLDGRHVSVLRSPKEGNHWGFLESSRSAEDKAVLCFKAHEDKTVVQDDVNTFLRCSEENEFGNPL